MAFIQSVKDSKRMFDLIRERHTAYCLLTLIAHRAKRIHEPDHPNPLYQELQIGEALIGDFNAYGVSEQVYRTDKKYLVENGYIECRKIKNNRKNGTVAKIIDKSVFDINADQFDTETSSPQLTDKATDKLTDKNTRPSTDKITESLTDKNQAKNQHSNGKTNGLSNGKNLFKATDIPTDNLTTNKKLQEDLRNITAALKSRPVANLKTVGEILHSHYGIPPDKKANRQPAEWELKAIEMAELLEINLADKTTKQTKNGRKTYELRHSWFKLFKPDERGEIQNLNRMLSAYSTFVDDDAFMKSSSEQKFKTLRSYCHEGKEQFFANHRQ